MNVSGEVEEEGRRPLSPRDNTPIIINGKEIDRSLLALGDEPIIPKIKAVTPVPFRAQSTPKAVGTKVPVPRIEVPVKRLPLQEVPQRLVPCPPKPVISPATPAPQTTPTAAAPAPPVIPPVVPQATPTAAPAPQAMPLPAQPKSKWERPTINLASIPDYSTFHPLHQANVRAAFKARLGDLRETWPEYRIEEIPDTVPLEHLHAAYLTYLRNIKLMEKVNNYKTLMYLGWYGFELLMKYYFKIDITDFANFQWKQINKYHFSLMQIGEQSLDSGEGAWDPRWSMIWVFGIQSILFMGMKLLSKIFSVEASKNLIAVVDDLLSGGRTMRNGQRVQRVSDGHGGYTDIPVAPSQRSTPDLAGILNSFAGAIMGGGNNNTARQDPNQPPPYTE